MNIQSIRKNVYGLEVPGLHKSAFLPSGSILGTAGGAISAAGDMTALGASYLVAASLITGIGTGWLASKAAEHGKQDEDTARKGYENERLKADIGYLRGKLKQEYSQAQRKGEPPRSMRLM